MATTILPAVSAIAAGNCAIIKPSEFAPESSVVLKKLCDLALDKRFYRCIEGGVQTSIRLTNTAFDYIVFTGGTSTGKIVAATASKHLTPCVLELGVSARRLWMRARI
jgi:aldehyde dehydrogenase (NAD+)